MEILRRKPLPSALLLQGRGPFVQGEKGEKVSTSLLSHSSKGRGCGPGTGWGAWVRESCVLPWCCLVRMWVGGEEVSWAECLSV